MRWNEMVEEIKNYMIIIALAVFIATIWTPEQLGKWLKQVDDARYENVIDQ